MNKKQLLERQIAKEFLGKIFGKSKVTSGDEGPYTKELRKSGQSVAGAAASAAEAFFPIDLVASAANATSSYLKSKAYKKIKDEMTTPEYKDVSEILKLMYNLQRLMEPSELKRIYDEDKSEDKSKFAINLVNEALQRVHIQGNQYTLSAPQTGYQAGEWKVDRS